MRKTVSLLIGIAFSLSLSATAALAEVDTANQPPKSNSAEGEEHQQSSPRTYEFAYIDNTGKTVITGPFAMAFPFSQGVAVVQEKPYEWHDGHWTAPALGTPRKCNTIIDTKNKTLNKIALFNIAPFRDQYTTAQVRKNSGSSFVLVDTHGGTTTIPECSQANFFAEGVFAVKGTDKTAGFGYMDKSGKLLIPYKYDYAGPFSDGLAMVGMAQTEDAKKAAAKGGQNAAREMRYSFINKSGEEVIAGPYQEAKRFQGGLAAVRHGEKWGYIDKKGKQVIPYTYEFAGSFSGPLAPVMKGGKVGFIDKTGKEVIPFKFKEADNFAEGLAPATIDGEHWGYIDISGAFKIEPTFKKGLPFNDGIALVWTAPRTDIGTHKDEAEYFYKTGNQLREDGFINDAIRYCDTAIHVAPHSEWASRASNLKLVSLPDHFIKQELLDLLMVGTLKAERQEFEPAAKIFKQCIDADPGFIQASGSLAYCLISEKKFAEAEPGLNDTLKKCPNYARGFFRLAQCYEGEGKLDQAQATLDKAKTLAPDDLLIQVYELTPTPQ